MTDKPKAAAKAAEQEQEDQDVPERRLDETVSGGKYLAADGKTFVDANGEPIDGKKS